MSSTVRRLVLAPALNVLDVFLPVHAVWWALFGLPLVAIMHWAVGFLTLFPVTLAIGPFGLAVIATTLLVRLVLLPLSAYQVRVSLRAHQESAAAQARLAPAIARLRRRYRGRPLEYQKALLELQRREGVDPMAGAGAALRGLVPTLLQAPVLIALYSVILMFARGGHDLHFLWLTSLAVPDPIILPVLAGLATLLLNRLTTAAQPSAPAADEGAAAAQRTAALLTPIAVAVAGHFAVAALVLYWATSSLVGAAQQWVVNRYVLSRSPAPA